MLMAENFNKREEDRHIKFYFEISTTKNLIRKILWHYKYTNFGK